MASDRFQGAERRRFGALLAVGGVLAAIVVVVAFIADPSIAWPLLILVAICVAAAVVFRLIAGSRRDDADHTDAFPRQPATRSRPLGDTPEAHDDVSPHDFPRGSPARQAAERQAARRGGTTPGHRQGGAAADDDWLVGPENQNGASI